MSSPFPGMDPYLERSVLWTGWHQAFTTVLCFELNRILPAHYVANLNERLYVVEPDRDIYPDVDVRERATPPSGLNGARSVALIEGDAPVIVAVEAEEVQEMYIDIVPVADQGRVVTAMEFLSPSNKTAGSAGRRAYRIKQREIVAGPAHLLEIDFLRRGEHTVAAPRDHLLRRGHFDYLVSLSRGTRRERCETWPFTVRQRLPRVCVPLLDPDPDVILNLQNVMDRCYDESAYARKIDYRREPEHPLDGPEAHWADALLRERGLRS